jgi:alkanesulfonate monooxygenase SsuD/methylene tetrahydromethanopterin reductase-like flavin-dependent oxidoreductase (luciferase family)
MTPEIGLSLPFTAAGQFPDPRALLRAAQQAEAVGYDAVWTGDHVLHPEPLLESVVTLSSLAACTRRVRLGLAVMLVALRTPLVLAKQLSTLTSFAPGRLVLGIGVGGEYPQEWDAMGIPVQERGARTTTTVAEVRRLLAGEGEVRLAPRPDNPVPMIFGGRRLAALRRAAIMGDGWVGQLHSPKAFAAIRTQLVALRQSIGANAPFSCGMLLRVRVSRMAEPAAEPHVLQGTPDALVDLLAPYLAAGCDRLILSPPRGCSYVSQCDELVPILTRLRALASTQ